MKADALSRLPTLGEQQNIETMLNHPQIDPHHHILNKYLLDLTLMNKYQQLDQTFLRAVKKDPIFNYTLVYSIILIM